MADADENMERDLFAHLSEIDEQLLEICEQGIVTDPDAIMEQLADQTGFVRECVDELMRDLEQHPERCTNLNQVVDLASREFLMATPFPVVVKTTLDPTLPDLSHADEAVLAVVLRALQLCGDHAGAGCDVQIATSFTGGRAQLRIEAHGSGTLDEPTLRIKLRSISLTDLMQSLRAEFTVSQERDVLTMSMCFGVEAPTV